MAKTSSVEKNSRRAKLARQSAPRRLRAEGDRATTASRRRRSVSRRSSSSPSCRATARERASATAAS